MNKKDIVVVIPVYKSSLTDWEAVSLRQCVRVLHAYTLVLIKPASLDVDYLLADYPMLGVEEFPDACFSSLNAYNKLVLDANFYRRFSTYTYLLIYQLDAYVFKDELLDWAAKGYDYIGAPWLPVQRGTRKWKITLKRYFHRLFHHSLELRRWKYIEFEVGNGGLSLRKIDKMIQVTHHYRNIIADLLVDGQPFYPEDVLLFVEIRNRKFRLSTPSYKEAMRFSLELGADWAYECMNRQLPFGCHAWVHKDNYPFWSAFISSGNNPSAR